MGMFKVYVGNLDRKATADDVRTLFVAFPDVEDIGECHEIGRAHV